MKCLRERRVGVEIAPDVRLGICGADVPRVAAGIGASETFFQLRGVLGRMGRRVLTVLVTVGAAARHCHKKVTANMQHVGMTQFAIMGVLLANWETSIKDFIYTGR